MMGVGIQIVLTCFAIFAMSRAFLRFRRGELAMVHLLMWLVLWGGLIVMVIHPDTSQRLAAVLGVGRGVDLAIYLALVSLFYMVFRLFGKIEDLERQITRVVRSAALKELDTQHRLPPPTRSGE